MQSFKSINYIFLVVLFFFLSINSNAQTDLEGGDIVILGVNANNSACGGGGGEDIITFVAFKDIVNTTQFDMTDNGWERSFPGLWGDSEGTLRFERTGGTITAGTAFEIVFGSDLGSTLSSNPGWTITDLNAAPVGTLNMNSSGDQIYIMQNGVWDNMGTTGDHNATYSGKILFGFNTRTTWNADGSSGQSNLHPEVDPCYYMNPTSGTTNYVHYTGPTSPATQLDWISRISDPSNWTSYSSCSDYNTIAPLVPTSISILTGGMSIDCSTCSASCPGFNETLIFNLPTSGGPFNVVYTDGTSNFTLNGISDQHVESLIINQSTTFSLVSVTALNGCPIYSNFDGEAMVTISGSGGGGNAVLSGGGVLCTDNCTTVTVSISGGTAPYTLNAVVNFPPLVNNFPISTPATVTNFDINVCSQGLLPSYDISTNTLSLPNFVTGNLTFALTGITDNTGCVGTVDPTPLAMTIEQTPTANAAGPMTECDEGGNTATFDLTSLNSTVNGGGANTVTWYEDMALNTTINNASNYSTTSTTVYATSSTVDCESEPVAVQLIVNPAPTASPASLTDCTPTGIATFDLTSLNSTVNGGTGFTVDWFTNSAGTNPILNPVNYTTNSGTVYATVTNNGCPSTPVAIILTVNTAPTGASTTMTVCESFTNPSFGDFDLTTINNIVNGGTGLPVAWFTDASATNPIPGSFITAQNNTIVYAVVGTAPCTSTAVSVTLLLTPFPPAVSTIIEECATLGNQAVFDLTSVDNIINAGSGAPVTWFEDIAGNNQIVLPSSYISGSTFVYAQTSNAFCNSPIQPVELIVTSGITATPTSATACDEGNGTATFDLNVIGQNVNSDPGNTVNWYFDLNATIPISSPYTTISTTVYAQVTNGTCESQIVAVGLAIDIAPTANVTSATACDSGNGTANFDLNIIALDVNNDPGNAVNWFSDINGNFPIVSPYNTASTTVYAEVTNGNCNSPIIPILLNVEAAPVANNTSAGVCDIGNGTGDFDLTLIGNNVNSTSGNTISWYSDIAATNPISSPYNTGSTIVYAIVSNGSCNSNTAEVILTVGAAPVANATISDACDIGNGTANFDLDAIAMIVNTNPAYTVNWFLYINGTNPILVSPFNSPTTFVYAVVSDGAGCESVITQVDLNVIPTPTANTTNATECDTGTGTADFDLTSLESIVNGGSSNTVSWYSDIAGINSISSPYNTSSTTVYAIVNGALCSSEPVAVDLIVSSAPTGISTNAETCINDGSGVADFDLTSLENIVNDGSGDPVLWYSDIGIANQIFSPYNTGTTTVYATVSIGNCVSVPVPVNLTVGEEPTANTASASLCDSGNGTATFDLTALENTINGGTTEPVSFFSDMGGTMLISSPYNTASTIVYATVTVGFCPSEPVAINLTVGSSPTANTTSASLCDEGGGMASFDLASLENTVGSGNIVTWYSDAAATNMIASPYSTSTTIVYAVVGDTNCASDPVAIDLTVENLPTATATSTSLCDEGSGMATFDLTSLENIVNGGNGNMVTWYSDASGSTIITSPFNSATATIYAIVSDGNCSSSIEAIELIVANLPEANPTTIANCDSGNGTADFDLNAIANTVNGGNGNPVSWFSDINLTTSITSPFNSTATTIYAVVNDANCTAAAVEVTLEITNDISANPTSLAACDDGTGSASFDLTDLNFQNNITGGNGNSISWFEDAAATNPLAPPFNALVTAPTSIYAVVVSGNCSSLPVEISLILSPEVPVANNFSISNCDYGDGTSSFDLDSQASVVNTGNGNQVVWAEDSGFTIQITSPFVSAPTTIYAIVTDGTCFSEIVEVELTVTNLLVGNSTTAFECDTNLGFADFDLDAIASDVNSDPTNTITWFSDANATTPISSPYNTQTTTVYAIVNNGPCQSQPVAVDLEVTTLTPAFSTTDTQCDDGTGSATFDLDVLANTVNGGNGLTVSWYSDAAATMSIGTPFTSAPTTVYAIVENGNCPSSIVAVTLDVSGSLPAFSTSDLQCDSGNGTADFNLDLLANVVNGGNGNTVNWYSNALATNSIASPFNSTSTSVYAIVTDGTCSSQIVEITLVVNNDLPAFPTTDTQCDDGSGTATFDLTTLENTVNGGNGNIVNWYSDASATIPSPTTITSGNTSIYAIVTDGTCASQIVEVTLTVENDLTAFPTTDTQCDDGSGTAIFDLTTLENTVNGGNGNTVNWYSDASATISSPTTITSGNTSVYAIVTDGTCASQIVEITLTVENNLTAFPTTDTQCDDGSGNATASFDLTNLENTINGGNGNMVNWYSDATATTTIPTILTTDNTSVYAIVTDGNCFSQAVEVELTVTANSVNDIIQTLCDGESIMVNNMVYNELNASGTETILGGNINGCDSIINVDLTFEPEITGTISASTNLTCPGNDVTLTFTLTGGTTYDVEFSEGGNPSTILNGISDGYTITVSPTATTTYSLESVIPLNTTCTAVIPSTQVTVQVEALDLIVVSISSIGGYDIVCANGNTGAAVVAPTNGIAPFTYLWSNGQTTDIASSLTAGNYDVTVTDANGCSGVSSIILTEPTLVEFDVVGVAPPCLDVVEGQIILENITGGIGSNYTYSFDGGPFLDVTNDTTFFDFVTVGEHTIFILDEVGCGFEQTIMVPEPIELTLELGDNQTIQLGESFEIIPQTNFVASNILWSENTACDTCFTQIVAPVNEVTYTLELFDENGCFITDEITILVEKNRNVFIPNAFSPDDNGFNDIFYINAGEDVEEVKNFRIFNRWGEVVFENENFQPNDPIEGWDGFFNGEKLNPSVLVFFAEIEFKDGEVKVYKGDVTLKR
jgi:gliding motility-associated-like protein